MITNAVRLVYWEKHESVGKAIAREKQLKRWRREKKMLLITLLHSDPPRGINKTPSREVWLAGYLRISRSASGI